MLSLAEAQTRLLALTPRMAIERVQIEQALGRYVVQDYLSTRNQPAADLSALDGYAIVGNGPWTVAGESRAGAPFDGLLSEGQAARISTGAHMPDGSDRVLLQENAARDGDTLSCTQDMPGPVQHVRKCGFDFCEGDVLVESGTRISPAYIALARSAGHARLDVRRAPRIAILETGDELAADPSACGEHQIPASNGAMLKAMLFHFGCDTTLLGPVADHPGNLRAALERAEDADIIVASGGASVGDHDHVKEALENWGADIDFWKVAIKPGKPLMVARRGKQLIFGLPGNPVSSFVTAFLFVLPCVAAAMGAASPLPRRARLIAGCDLKPGNTRQEFLRAVWDGETVRPIESQDSSALMALAASNCLIERAIDAPPVAKGNTVGCFLLETG